MGNLILAGTIIIFQTTAISKIVFPSFITTVPKYIVNKNEKIQKPFYGKTLLLRENMKPFVMIIKLEH